MYNWNPDGVQLYSKNTHLLIEVFFRVIGKSDRNGFIKVNFKLTTALN
jgi:hypothetical protein